MTKSHDFVKKNIPKNIKRVYTICSGNLGILSNTYCETLLDFFWSGTFYKEQLMKNKLKNIVFNR